MVLLYTSIMIIVSWGFSNVAIKIREKIYVNILLCVLSKKDDVCQSCTTIHIT